MQLPVVDSLRASIAVPLRRSLGAAPAAAHERCPSWAGDRDPGWFGPGLGGLARARRRAVDADRRDQQPAAADPAPRGDGRRRRALQLAGRPRGRLQRTAGFLAATTYGTTGRPRPRWRWSAGIHGHVRGTRPDGVPYQANDPELLRWVHVAEVFQFLRAYQRYGFPALTTTERDDYLAAVARTGEALGATGVPHSVADVEPYFDAVRPDLAATPAAIETAHDLLVPRQRDPLQRAAFEVIARASVGLLPGWARDMLGLQRRALVEDQAAQAAATAMSFALRWAIGAPRAAA